MTAPAIRGSARCLLAAALLLALGAAAPVVGQEKEPWFALRRWTTAEGLPSQFVNDLAQTGDGFLWAVVARRLVRFDGLHFTIFRPGADGLPDSDPLGIGAGRGDTLWIVTLGGHLVSHVRGRFRVALQGDVPWEGVATDSAGRLWVWDESRIGLRRDTSLTLVTSGSGLFRTRDFRPAAAPAPAGGIWAAAEVLRHVDSTGRRTDLGDAGDLVPLDGRTGDPLVLRRDGAWVDLVRLSGEVAARVPWAPGRLIRLIDRRGRIWTTTDGTVEGFRSGESRPVAVFSLGAGVAIRVMIEDRDGGIWIGTYTEGLALIEEVPFNHLGQVAGLSERAVMHLGRGPSGSLTAIDIDRNAWLIAGGRAVSLFRSVRGPGRSDPASAEQALTAPDGSVWLLVGEGGRDAFRRVGGGAAPVWIDGRIRDQGGHALPSATGDHDYWLTAWGLRRVRMTDSGPDLGPVLFDRGWRLTDVATDSAGAIWVVAADSIARIRGTEVSVFGPDEPGSARFRSVAVTPDGTVWIGSYGRGIARFSGGRFERVTEADGLGEDIVTRILPDGLGNFWMAGDRSIHRVAIADLTAFLAGGIPRVGGVRYGRGDGIPNPEATGGTAHRAADGTLWFPTFDGIASVDPAVALSLGDTPPELRIERVIIGADTVSGGQKVRLPRPDASVAVEFSAVSLRNPAAMAVEYTLEAGDRGWRSAGDQRRIEFGSLRAGTHRFRLRARSAGGAWASIASPVAIVVPPRFRDTPGFLVLLGTGLVLLVIVASRYRTRRAVAQAAYLQRTVDDRTVALRDEQRRTQEALDQVAWQAEQLREADRERTRVFTNVTHELRTPLTLILGPLADLAAGRRGALPAPALADIGVVRQNAARLKEMVDQLLELNRIGAGAAVLRIGKVDLADFFHRVAAPFEVHARSVNKVFRMTLEIGGPEVWFDPASLETVVTNLLGNAFNYTPEGGRVSLSAAQAGGDDGSRLIIRVTDTGSGIPREELGRIFDRFHRVDERHRGAPSGTGLGLALTRELVVAHGGTIVVTSEVGQGTEFTVTIPVGEKGEAEAAAGDESAAPERPTVIVVEDHPDMRAFIARQLADEYRVVEAADGQEGLEAARAQIPDAVVTDLMMPSMTGEELCRRLKSDPELDYVPVIILTAKSSHDSRLEGLRQGADAYLTKPFDAEELRLTVRNAVGTRRRLRERLREAGATVPEVPAPEPVASPPSDPETERFVARFQAVLAERVGEEDLDVPLLARALDLSRSTVYRRAMDAFGRPPMEVVWDFRLDQGAAWLRETDATVAEVAYGVGFKSVSHFTRRFRERFGSPPAAWRRG